jgi:hypothetical protein
MFIFARPVKSVFIIYPEFEFKSKIPDFERGKAKVGKFNGMNGRFNQRDDALRQSSYPTNSGKYLVYIPLSRVRMALHSVEANPPI